MTFWATAATFPDLKLTDVFTDDGAKAIDDIMREKCVHAASDTIAYNFGDAYKSLLREKPTNVEGWVKALIEESGPQVKPVAPVIIFWGRKTPSYLRSWASSTASRCAGWAEISRACSLPGSKPISPRLARRNRSMCPGSRIGSRESRLPTDAYRSGTSRWLRTQFLGVTLRAGKADAFGAPRRQSGFTSEDQTRETKTMNGAQSLFKALVDAGITTCFANPGTSEMQLVYEMGLSEAVRPILCLQEDVVTGAADGFGRMTGRPRSRCFMSAAASPTASRCCTTPRAPTRRSSTSSAPMRPTISRTTRSTSS